MSIELLIDLNRIRNAMDLSLLAFALLCLTAQGYCYNYWKGDVLPAFTNNSYCRTLSATQAASSYGQSQTKS